MSRAGSGLNERWARLLSACERGSVKHGFQVTASDRLYARPSVERRWTVGGQNATGAEADRLNTWVARGWITNDGAITDAGREVLREHAEHR